MGLEQDLHQKKFATELHKLALNVIFTAGWLGHQSAISLKPYGLSPQQFNVLRILRGQYPKSASANLIASRMIDRNSNVSRLIDKLLLKQWVSRMENPDDRRSIQVAITDKGLNTLARIDQEVPDLDTHFRHLTLEEAQAVNAALDKIREKERPHGS